MGVVLNLLRQQLIDFALDTKNRAMFERLTAAGWEKFIIEGSTDAESLSHYLVLHDSMDGPMTTIVLPNTDQPTIFAIPVDEVDERGWRDVYGLTFYDRLRSKGPKRSHDWLSVTESEWVALKQTHRVVHPKNFKIVHPSKTTILPEN